MKIIPIPLSFGLTDTIYETKMGFKTADVNSAVLQFTSDSDPVGCVATLSMKNETDNSNRFSLVLEQMNVTENPFSYTLGDEIGSSGVWIGEITLKKDLVTVCSQEFRFSVGESLQTSIMDVLIQAKSVDEMMVAIQGDVTEHLGKSDASVKQITAYVNGVVAKLLATDNTRTLQERDRVLAELARETDYQSWVLAVQTLIDTAVIDARVQAIIDAYQSTYAQSLLSVTQQLAEKTSEITKSAKRDLSLSTIKRDIPLVSFVDDDGNPAVLTKLRPLAEMYGVPFTICMPSDFIINGNGLSATQLKDLQDSNGFEIASHGKTHTPINTSMTAEQQEIEVYESWRQMRELGLNVETIVYPYGQSTPYSREIVSRYYKAGVTTDVRLNATPLLTYRLGRLQFPTTGWTLANYTAKVDEAIANKSWLIFMLHCGQPEHDAANQIILEQLIQYIQSVNVDIVTISDGIDISGNVIDINEQAIYYAKNGKNNIRDYYFEPIDNTNNNALHNALNVPSDFPDYKKTINILTNALDKATAPNGKAGAMETAQSNLASAVAYQMYYTVRGIFYRSGGGNSWHDVFNRVFAGIPVTFTLDFGTIPAGAVVTKDYQIQNMFAGHFIELTNKTNLHRNLMLSKHISGAWTLSINIFNPTASPIIVGEVGFDVLWMKPAT